MAHRDVGAVAQFEVGGNKAYDYCGAVVRSYATFERFVLDVVEEWLRWCLEYHPARVLDSEAARSAYEAGYAEIIRRRSDTRFADVDRGSLARGIQLFYSDVVPADATLAADPFFAALPNLRLPHIFELFKVVSLGAAERWVAESAPITQFCKEEGYSLAEELKQLVERRNEAAHGNDLPRDILGTNELASRVDLLCRLCACLHEFALARVCRTELGEDLSLGLIGRVSHVWPKPAAFELIAAHRPVDCDARVLAVGRSSLVASSICSIHVADAPLKRYAGEPGSAIGIKMNHLPSVGAKIVAVDSVRGLLPLVSEDEEAL